MNLPDAKLIFENDGETRQRAQDSFTERSQNWGWVEDKKRFERKERVVSNTFLS